MKLNQLVAEYVAFKQSLGMRFRAEAVILKAFCRAIGDVDITEVGPCAVLAYLAGTGPITSFWHRKLEALRGFYRYVLGRGYLASSPLPTTIPKRPQPFVAYIYTPEEVRRLLDATDRLESTRSHLQPVTFRTLLLLLYGTGLRISEALSLTGVDVDLLAGVLTIRDSKFFKTRLVPIGPRLTTALGAYVHTQAHRAGGVGESRAFFVKRDGTAATRSCAELTFRRVCHWAGIDREDGARYQPRLHDMRHTFASHRLVEWYREGADVQRLLPHLATYLGHVNISATQRYLTMTPELLQEANRRFEHYALSEVSHG